MIELPLPPKMLSPNVKPAHWAVKVRATRKYRECCYYIARVARPRGWSACPVEIDVEYRCSRGAAGYVAKDIQNAMASIKAGCDGLIDAGIALDDSKAHFTWGAMSLVTVRSPKGDGITVIVRKKT